MPCIPTPWIKVAEGLELLSRFLHMCRDSGKVLLMRKVKHGAGKWGMPGGSQDSKDADSLATAEREFRSEIGEPPQHEVKGQILMRRYAPTLTVKW